MSHTINVVQDWDTADRDTLIHFLQWLDLAPTVWPEPPGPEIDTEELRRRVRWILGEGDLNANQ